MRKELENLWHLVHSIHSRNTVRFDGDGLVILRTPEMSE